MDKEMVKKSLKNCIGVKPCKDCPYEKGGFMHFPSCVVDLLKDALKTIEQLEKNK